MKNTIIAQSTPVGLGALSVIRISGDKALFILQSITHKTYFSPREMSYVTIYTPFFLEKALCVYFPNPNSFTGEDCVEIHCHGGVFIAPKIIEECCKFGAEMAGPGQFSMRAFMNGKLPLIEAEGIIDMINSESSAQAKLASDQLNGKLSKEILNIQNILKDKLAHLNAIMDYPEYDIEEVANNEILSSITSVRDIIVSMLDTYNTGKVIKNGVNIVLIGAPNVGKSTLLNALSDSNDAIVSDIAGTTRDIIRSKYVFNGVVFNIADTAGIRTTDDSIEKIGIQKANEEINNSDIIISVADKNNPPIHTSTSNILIYTKSDIFDYKEIIQHNNIDSNKNSTIDTFFINSNNILDIISIKKMIYSKSISTSLKNNVSIISNSRHFEALKYTLEYLELAIESLQNNMPLDCTTTSLSGAWKELGKLTGIDSPTDILDTIFSKFCLGK